MMIVIYGVIFVAVSVLGYLGLMYLDNRKAASKPQSQKSNDAKLKAILVRIDKQLKQDLPAAKRQQLLKMRKQIVSDILSLRQ